MKARMTDAEFETACDHLRAFLSFRSGGSVGDSRVMEEALRARDVEAKQAEALRVAREALEKHASAEKWWHMSHLDSPAETCQVCKMNSAALAKLREVGE